MMAATNGVEESSDVERDVDAGDDDFKMEDFHGGSGNRMNKAVANLVTRPGNSLTRPEFEPSKELLEFMQNNLNILVIGAGGLGCELLKDLALLGFRQLHVIDMDTIDLSNLNRQFLFRHSDIGKSKAECAARFINERIPQCNVQAYCKRIEEFDEEFYRNFPIIVCGLDSIQARRWMNGMIMSLLRYSDEGALDPTSIIPMVDGGTEGFKGNLRVIVPGVTACLECSMDLYPPAVNFPMCTIAHTPRLPEHCVEYVKVVMWPKMEPFGAGVAVDGDDPQHVQWITSKAEERAKEYGIQGVTYRLTLGVVKNIIPAVASTNAIVAALCATEVLKIASFMYPTLDNFLLFNDTDGIYSSSFQIQRNENCLACSRNIQKVEVKSSDSLQDLIDMLKDHPSYQMRSPGITTTIDGKKKTMYIPNIPALELATRDNLEKSLESLGLTDEQQIIVADATSPDARVFTLRFR